MIKIFIFLLLGVLPIYSFAQGDPPSYGCFRSLVSDFKELSIYDQGLSKNYFYLGENTIAVKNGDKIEIFNPSGKYTLDNKSLSCNTSREKGALKVAKEIMEYNRAKMAQAQPALRDKISSDIKFCEEYVFADSTDRRKSDGKKSEK
jgi:hypothetical protein